MITIMEFIIIMINYLIKLYVMHNTTNKAARGEVSLHLNAFACPSPIEERKWGVSGGRVSSSKASFSRYKGARDYSVFYNQSHT